MVSVLFYLQKHKISHGDIRPSTILLTKTGVVKVADINFINDDSSVYFKLFSHTFLENHYIGPDFIDSLRKLKLTPHYDTYKNDIFAFGMTILEAATLEYSSLCYDYTKFNINFERIEGLLDSLTQRYSIFFINFLKDVLQEKEKYRPNFEDLNSLLSPFQSSDNKTKKQKSQNIISKQTKYEEREKSPLKKTKNPEFNQNINKNKENVLTVVINKNKTNDNSEIRLRQKFVMMENGMNSNFNVKNGERNVKFMNESSNLKKKSKNNVFPLSLKDNNICENNNTDIKCYNGNEIKASFEDQELNYRSSQLKIDNWQSENERLNEIERKINEALRLSEETIKIHGNLFVFVKFLILFERIQERSFW